MSRQVRIYMNDAEHAKALANHVNSQASQNGLEAQVRGSELVIAPANPLVEDLVAGIGYVIRRVSGLFQAGDRDMPVDSNTARG